MSLTAEQKQSINRFSGDEIERLIDHGIFSRNEVRLASGFDEIDGGDIHTVITPTGLVPVNMLDQYFKRLTNK